MPIRYCIIKSAKPGLKAIYFLSGHFGPFLHILVIKGVLQYYVTSPYMVHIIVMLVCMFFFFLLTVARGLDLYIKAIHFKNRHILCTTEAV